MHLFLHLFVFCIMQVRSLSTIGGEIQRQQLGDSYRTYDKKSTSDQNQLDRKRGKIASLKLKEVLKETVIKNHPCPNATDAEIYSIAKYWFRFASREGERRGQRKRGFPQHKTKPIGNRRKVSQRMPLKFKFFIT